MRQRGPSGSFDDTGGRERRETEKPSEIRNKDKTRRGTDAENEGERGRRTARPVVRGVRRLRGMTVCITARSHPRQTSDSPPLPLSPLSLPEPARPERGAESVSGWISGGSRRNRPRARPFSPPLASSISSFRIIRSSAARRPVAFAVGHLAAQPLKHTIH